MKPSVLISIALVLGGIAAFVVSRWIGIGGKNDAGPPVVVAAANIEAGMPIAANQLSVLRWPSAQIPPGAIADKALLIGRIARQPVFAGEPVLEPRLAAVDAKGGLAAVIEQGKRAITVRVNDVVAVAGFALPGSYVDVMVSAKDLAGNPFSKIVLTRVKVLAIAQETQAEPTKPKVVNAVTLELTPQESEQLDLARSIGTLSLVLRNEMDKEAVTASGARLEDLIRNSGPAARPAPAAAPTAAARQSAPRPIQSATGVEEIRGTQTSTTEK